VIQRKIVAVLFDLDGTLSDRDTAVTRFAVDQYQRMVMPAHTPVPQEEYVKEFIARDQHGYVHKTIVYQQMCDVLPLKPLVPEVLCADFYARIRYFQTPMPSLRPMLNEMHARGFALGIITNAGVAMQMDTLDVLGIRADFASIVISEAVGMKKPDPAIFLHALQTLHATPDVALFIGDHPVTDIRAAHAVGLRTIWKRVPYWPAAGVGEQVIDDLNEIPDIIDRMMSDPDD